MSTDRLTMRAYEEPVCWDVLRRQHAEVDRMLSEAARAALAYSAAVVAADEAASAYLRACDRLDAWLVAQRDRDADDKRADGIRARFESTT